MRNVWFIARAFFISNPLHVKLLSVTPKEMADEQENDSVPSGEEVQLKKCSEDDWEGCVDGPRVGRRDTASESEGRQIPCKKKKRPQACQLFLGRKRRLSRGVSSFSETPSRRDGVANPLIRALRSKFCSGDKSGFPICRGPAGGKKKYLRETAVPEWKSDTNSDDPSKGACSPDDLFCLDGKRTVG